MKSDIVVRNIKEADRFMVVTREGYMILLSTKQAKKAYLKEGSYSLKKFKKMVKGKL